MYLFKKKKKEKKNNKKKNKNNKEKTKKDEIEVCHLLKRVINYRIVIIIHRDIKFQNCLVLFGVAEW